MFGLLKKKLVQPDMLFASKGYIQIAMTRLVQPDFPSTDLHIVERGYASQLLHEGCSLQQAHSARWGGVVAINDDGMIFSDAVLAVRKTRTELEDPEKFRSKEEAEAHYLAAATAILAFRHTMDPGGYEHFLKFVGAR